MEKQVACKLTRFWMIWGRNKQVPPPPLLLLLLLLLLDGRCCCCCPAGRRMPLCKLLSCLTQPKPPQVSVLLDNELLIRWVNSSFSFFSPVSFSSSSFFSPVPQLFSLLLLLTCVQLFLLLLTFFFIASLWQRRQKTWCSSSRWQRFLRPCTAQIPFLLLKYFFLLIKYLFCCTNTFLLLKYPFCCSNTFFADQIPFLLLKYLFASFFTENNRMGNLAIEKPFGLFISYRYDLPGEDFLSQMSRLKYQM